MIYLTDAELDELIRDAGALDRHLAISGSPTITGRLQRLLAENRELREQAAERDHLFAMEHET